MATLDALVMSRLRLMTRSRCSSYSAMASRMASNSDASRNADIVSPRDGGGSRRRREPRRLGRRAGEAPRATSGAARRGSNHDAPTAARDARGMRRASRIASLPTQSRFRTSAAVDDVQRAESQATPHASRDDERPCSRPHRAGVEAHFPFIIFLLSVANTFAVFLSGASPRCTSRPARRG